MTDLGSGTKPLGKFRRLEFLQDKATHRLQTPSEKDLSGSLAEFFHKLLHYRLLKSLSPDNGTVGFTNNPSLVAPFDDVWPSEPRMKFPLTNTDFTALAFTVLLLELLDEGL